MLDIIEKRRAVYPVQYTEDPITAEEIIQVLEAANWAPTHRRTEPWRFKVFHTLESRRRLSDFLEAKYREVTENPSEIKARKTAQKPIQSGCVIAICMQRDPLGSIPEWEEVAATAMAVQNMWLRSTELGIGAYWSTPATREYLNELLPLAEGEKCLGFFFMGKVSGEWQEGLRISDVQSKTTWV